MLMEAHLPTRREEVNEDDDVSDTCMLTNEIVPSTAQIIWQFSKNHGDNIELSNNYRSAERAKSYWGDGIVLSNKPMVVDTVYEVLVEEIDTLKLSGYMRVGVAVGIPTSVLPLYSWLLKDAIVIGPYVTSLCGQWKATNYGLELKKLTVGNRVGVRVDNGRNLHLHINGLDRGVVVSNVSLPCYALFDVRGLCKKVTTLPLTSKLPKRL